MSEKRKLKHAFDFREERESSHFQQKLIISSSTIIIIIIIIKYERLTIDYWLLPIWLVLTPTITTCTHDPRPLVKLKRNSR